jgi:hypothetical protein
MGLREEGWRSSQSADLFGDKQGRIVTRQTGMRNLEWAWFVDLIMATGDYVDELIMSADSRCKCICAVQNLPTPLELRVTD